MKWKIWKKIVKDLENTEENCEMIWNIQKKDKLNSEIIQKIWKKSELNSEMIWKIWKKIVKRFGIYRRKIC